MAGHSKWANIKHRKQAADAKRGQQFTKLAKEIMVSSRLGGSDVSTNPRLKAAITKAREFNMPKDNIEKAIKKGAGELDGQEMEELVYEGYGTQGVAFIVEVMTDKKTRTVPELKNIFSKNGGSMAETGSVGFMFDHLGVIALEGENITEDTLMELVINSGAEDYEKEDDNFFIVKTSMENFHNAYTEISNEAEKNGWQVVTAELQYLPKTYIDLDADGVKTNMRIFETLEANDDVQNIYFNLNVPDDEE